MPDVVVIGGGIIGAACADALTRRGASVTLVERDELAAGASGRNQGLWVPPEDPVLHQIASRSLARYLEIADEAPLPIRIDALPIGTVFVAVDDESIGAATDTLAAVSAGGFAVKSSTTPRSRKRSRSSRMTLRRHGSSTPATGWIRPRSRSRWRCSRHPAGR